MSIVISETWSMTSMSTVYHYKDTKLCMLTDKIKEGEEWQCILSKPVDFIEIKSVSSVVDNIMECVAVES